MSPHQIIIMINRMGVTPSMVEVNNTRSTYLNWVNTVDQLELRHSPYEKNTEVKIYPSGYDFAITFES